MVIKAFWDNPYATTHATSVAATDGCEVELKSTIFFAFSGGQESDEGTINGIPVISAQKDGKRIKYTLPESHGLSVGQTVDVVIDWARRYRLMRHHFAAELVLELFYNTLEIDKIGAHIAQNKARIDFVYPESIASMLPFITEKANDIISKDLEIKTGFDPIASERRYWAIDGFSKVPCGGTHVRSTGEVGCIKLKRNNIGKGKERVEIYLCAR